MKTSYNQTLQIGSGNEINQSLFPNNIYEVWFIHKDRRDRAKYLYDGDNTNYFLVAALSPEEALYFIDEWYGKTFESIIPKELYDIEVNVVTKNLPISGILTMVYSW